MQRRTLLTILFCAALLLPLPFAAHADTETVYLINPLGITDPRLIIGRIIKGVLSVIGSVTLLMFVYGGVLWITAMGEQKKVDRGKHILVWGTLGIGVVAGSYVFVNALINAFTQGSV